MASLRCHGDSNHKKFSSLYNTVVVTFSHIFTHANVVKAQTWEVSPPKKTSRATLIARLMRLAIILPADVSWKRH